MAKKPKYHTCNKGWCTQHIFEIKPLTKSVHFKRIQKMRMCPMYNEFANKFNKIFPTYNRDGKFYTPSFMIEQDKNFDFQKDQRYKNNHNKKANQNPSGISQMFIPNLGRKNKYCNVCRDDIEDYLEHIKHPNHKKNLNSNKFSQYITEMQKKYRKVRKQMIMISAPSQNALEQSTQLQNNQGKVSNKKTSENIQNLNMNAALQDVSVKID